VVFTLGDFYDFFYEVNPKNSQLTNLTLCVAKKSENLFGFGETLPGCLTFCTEIWCTTSATAIKQWGIFIAKQAAFYGIFTTAYRGY
jgi:hypothetical protein